jgi:hypothetical protein
MYNGARGDPLLYLKHVTQFVDAARTHTLHMNKKKYGVLVRLVRTYCGPQLKRFVSTCWRTV